MSDTPEIKKGTTFVYLRGPVKVMAVADGYAMCRRPRCMPFIMTVDRAGQLLRKHMDDQREPVDTRGYV